jgi:hypothetical protein
MDCNHARLLLLFSRTASELEAAEAEALAGHLEQCAQCGDLAGTQRQLDEAVSKAMRSVAVPADLSGRLLLRLAHEGNVRRWRRVAAGAALAAALLLAVGLTWFFWLGAKTTPDYELVDAEISDKVRASPQTVEQWFRDRGISMEAPRQFNYALLTSYDTAQFMNRRVPKLLFFYRGERDSAVAEVYVLSAKQFHLDKDPQHPPSMELLTGNPNFHYLVSVFPRGDSRPFMVNPLQN